ncbi:hypothetical protein TKK_0011659 [Trichogramma kaykai]
MALAGDDAISVVKFVLGVLEIRVRILLGDALFLCRGELGGLYDDDFVAVGIFRCRSDLSEPFDGLLGTGWEQARDLIHHGEPGSLGLPPPPTLPVGPNRRRNASEASDPSTDGAVPTNQPTTFHCEFSTCDRTFATNQGRGQHHRLAHRAWNDARIIATANTNRSKPRWDKEEVALMARREAEMIVGDVRYINKALAEEFTSRSLEAIKGQRKDAGYKAEVAKIVALLKAPALAPPTTTPTPLSTPTSSAEEPGGFAGRLVDYLTSLPPLPASAGFQGERLLGLLLRATTATKEEIFQDLSLYLKAVLPAKQFHRRARGDFNIQASAGRISNRKKRRRDYAITQRHWKSSRTRCARAILDDACDAIQQPPRQRMEEYWSTVFTQPPVNTSPSVLHFQASLLDLWAPITPNEIRAARPSLSVSPGPDGLTSRQLRAIPLDILVRIFNLILLCERLPRDFTLARTIFIPKKSGALDPGEFRPITVTSSFTRLFHRILAIRADSLLDLDDSQRAFRSGIDGCRDNTMLLDAILRSHYERFESASIATLDLAKAFDSVEHSAIMRCGAAAGLPPPMIRYLRRFYEDGTTTLMGDQWTSLPIRPTRGVKQGDPLSPVLFNIVIDHLLRSLPSECGIPFCGRTIRAMAFADDLVLLAQTPAGLQKLLDHTASFLAECGLRVNSSKCHSLTIRGLGQAKKTVVDAGQRYCVNGQQIRALTSEDTWTYLGIVFSAQGRRKFDSASKISLLLERLTKAPLKPQQRLYALKCYALPRVYHAMSLGNTTISDLTRVDVMTRAFVRQWLALPNDTPTGYFHAPLDSGAANDNTSGTNEDFSFIFVRREIAVCERRLTDGRTILRNTDSIGRRWARLLHSSIEGRALKDSCYTIGQHSWVSDGTALLNGKGYIACHRVRIGALPTRSRLTRGRHGDRHCRAGCRAQETNNHVLQICPRTHAARMKRHDVVANYISRRLTRQGFEVRSEPHIPTSIGVRKPDLVATMGDFGVVLDIQIASDQVDLNFVRHEKIRKYSTLPEVSRYITRETGATNIRHLPVVLSWRGVWGRRSSLDLLALGTVNRRDLTVIATRTLIGGSIAHRDFANSTSVT